MTCKYMNPGFGHPKEELRQVYDSIAVTVTLAGSMFSASAAILVAASASGCNLAGKGVEDMVGVSSG